MQIEENNRQKSELVKNLDLHNEKDTVAGKDVVTVKKLDYSEMKNVTKTGAADILSFYIRDVDGNDVVVLKPRKKYTFGIVAEFYKNVDNALFGFEMENTKGVKLFGINNFQNNSVLKTAEAGKIYEVRFELTLPAIHNGEYLISPSIAAGEQENHVVLMRIHNEILINVDNSEGYNIAIMDLDSTTTMIERNKKSIKFY
jgi:hypothetical protein